MYRNFCLNGYIQTLQAPTIYMYVTTNTKPFLHFTPENNVEPDEMDYMRWLI